MAEPLKQILARGEKVYPHYWSTACIHDRHDECRRTCKFCDQPCRCSCHQGTDAGAQ